MEYEAQRFSEMAATPESESLIGLFEGSTALKKNRFGKPAKKVCVWGGGFFFVPYSLWLPFLGVVLSPPDLLFSVGGGLLGRLRCENHEPSHSFGLVGVPRVQLSYMPSVHYTVKRKVTMNR